EVDSELSVFHLGINATDLDRYGRVPKLHVGSLSHAHARQIKLIHFRRELESRFRSDLREPPAALAVLTHFQIELREPPRHRGTNNQVVEFAAHDTEILLELVQ